MAKGQKKSNREIRKPKKEKPKTETVQVGFLNAARPPGGGKGR